MIPRGITADHIRRAIRDFESGEVPHRFADSTGYDLVVDGSHYPPKAIVGLAARYISGKPLMPSDFSGGVNSPCFRLLERLGFSLEAKAGHSATEVPAHPPLDSDSSEPFAVGDTYRRRADIHSAFGGQQQGGISTPSGKPFVLLFTGEEGGAFGYRDGFQPDGTFWYTGEGQVGDMKMVAGNTAIRDHEIRGKTLELFEKLEDSGLVRYMGRAAYVGHHLEERPDRNGQARRAIVFELAMEPQGISPAANPPHTPAPKSRKGWWELPIEELRRRAKQKVGRKASTSERRRITYERSEAVKVYVLKRAAGRCEGCTTEAPFRTSQGQPYLEPHHIWRVSDGGPDDPDSVIGLCPNCHRRVHYSIDGKAYNDTLAERMKGLEPSE